MSVDLDKLDWQTTQGPAQPEVSRLRDPARALTALGAVGMLVGCLMPWAAGIDGLGRSVSFGANDGTADGVLIIVAAVFVLVVTLDRGAAQTRSRTLQLAPFLTMILAALIWSGGFRSTGFAIDAWVGSGGSGTRAPGIWLTIAGIAVAAIGSGWIHLRRPAEIRAATASLRAEWALTRQGVAEAVAGMIGAIIGGSLGLAVAVAVAGSLGVLLMVILSATGLTVGMRLGILLVRQIGSRTAGP